MIQLLILLLTGSGRYRVTTPSYISTCGVLSGESQAGPSICSGGCVPAPHHTITTRLAREEAGDCVRVCSLLHKECSQVGLLGDGNYTFCWCLDRQITSREVTCTAADVIL